MMPSPSGPPGFPLKAIQRVLVALPCLVLVGLEDAGGEPTSDLLAAARRLVAVPGLPAAPLIDCRLDDEAWRVAAVLGDFVQTHPGDNTPPQMATEVRLGLTPHALHIAIRADDEPRRVRATLGKRDALDQDDVVSLYLDTFHDERRAYVITVNPLGVQQDGVLVDGREADLSIDLVFESRGCLTSTGYAIELSLPFESMRYGRRSWGLHVVRVRRDADEEISWLPLRRDRVATGMTSVKEVRARFLSQAGALTGFAAVPNAMRAEIIPVATTSRASAGRAGNLVARSAFHGGLTARLALSSSVAVDLAANPDFAEIEADQLQLTANQRFPLFYEEKRPFFLEGGELLQTPLRAFYSRAVVDPTVALKAVGQRGRTSVAAFVAADAAPGTFTDDERADPLMAETVLRLGGKRSTMAAVRVRRDVGTQSSLGLLATSYRFVDRSNHVAGVDGRIGLGARSVLNLQALGTTARQRFFDSETGETRDREGHGLGYWLDLSWANRRASLQLTGEGYTPDYRADLGYTQRTDTNRWSAMVRFNATPRPEGTLTSWSVMNTTLAQFDWRGRMQYAYVYPRLRLALKRQTNVTLSAYRDYIRVFEEEFGASRGPSRQGAFAGPSAERSTLYHGLTIAVDSAPTRTLAFGLALDRAWHQLDYDLGAGPRFPRVSPGALIDPNAPLDPGPGSTSYASLSVTYRPQEKTAITVAHERSRLEREETGRLAFDQHLWSLRVQQALSRFTSVRVRLDADSVPARLAGQVMFAWTPTPRTALYAGYNEAGSWLEDVPLRPVPLGPYRPAQRTWFLKMSWGLRARLGGTHATEAPR